MNTEILEKMSIADLKAAFDYATEQHKYYSDLSMKGKENKWFFIADQLEGVLEERILAGFSSSLLAEMQRS